MKLTGKHKELFIVDFKETEVEEIYNYVNLDDMGIEIVEGSNVLELNTLEVIYEPLSDLQYHNKTTFHIVETLEELIN